jgi:GTP cyclohydrolase I
LSTGSDDSDQRAVSAARDLFDALGLDADQDPELDDTPERFVELLQTTFEAVGDAPPQMSTFPNDNEYNTADPVILAELPFHSMCVHHVVPFFGHIDVAYIPDDRMTGFGSVSRVIDHFAHRPQIQEQLVDQIAGHLADELQPRGVFVRCVARQMCMEMRGAKKRGRLVSSASRGVLTDGDARAECLAQFEGDSPP